MREPPAGRRVQVPRRLQRHRALSTTRSARRGVVAFSSGNHAQAIALPARLLGVPATIVMPHGRAGDEGRGDAGLWRRGRVLRPLHARTARRSAAGSPPSAALTLIPPYDHPDVIAGQGTAAQGADRGGRPARRAARLPRRRRAAGRLARSRPRRCRPAARSSASSRRPATTASGRFRTGEIVRIPVPQIDRRRRADPARWASTPSRSSASASTTWSPCRDAAAGRGDALLRRAHEDRRRADRLPRPPRPSCDGAFAGEGKRVGVIISGGNVDPAMFSRLMLEQKSG